MRRLLFGMVAAIVLCSCSESESITPGTGVEPKSRTLLIGCEGNYGGNNASLSWYKPDLSESKNEVYKEANGELLGDVAHSVTLHEGLCWVTSNNSGEVYTLDPKSFKRVGSIDIPSPRYIHFISPEKAYVSQLFDARIAIINPKTYTLTGWIETDMEPESASTEQWVEVDGMLYTNCWSYQRQLLKIDPATDQIVASLEVGIQPSALTKDKNDKLWVLCDGGQWEGNPLGCEAPTILRIDPHSFTIEKRFELTLGEFPSKLQCNPTGDRLYWLNQGVWQMDVEADRLPLAPHFTTNMQSEYGLTIDPATGEIYLSDALDYMQAGQVLRYSVQGELMEQFTVGVCPSTFAWME